MPEKLLRIILIILLKCLFRLRLRGAEHATALKGKGAMIIANHQSFLDPLLLAVFLPEKPAFAMSVEQANKWYFKPLLTLVDIYAIDPLRPLSTKGIIQRLRKGSHVVIFPEGRITTTGGIMKIYDGAGLIADRTGVPILPVRVEGAQYSLLSRLGGKVHRKLLPQISITLSPPQLLDLSPDAHGKKRRELAANRIYDLLVESAFTASPWRDSLTHALIRSGRLHGMRRAVATDVTQKKLSMRGLITKATALGSVIPPPTGGRLGGGQACSVSAENAPTPTLPLWGREQVVGVLLPTSLAALVTFFALHFIGRVPAMLNATAGIRNLLLACEAAKLETVLTSRLFIERGNLQPVIAGLEGKVRVVYLEDLREKISPAVKIRALLAGLMPELFLKRAIAVSPDAPAAILYTSGSEGTPKGVVLSHANILANIHQAAARLSFTESDLMFNALPVFHSFGLSIGMLLPPMLGIRVFLYPSPLHYRIVPELIYDSGATIMLGTDTFYAGYAKYAQAMDFYTLRLAVAGAEKLKEKTRLLYAERYGLRILEGYGVTETSPAVAINTPLENRPGSVGRLFPGMEARLEPVPGLEKGGRLLLKGPNVMLGYLRAENPGVLERAGEWYDTGDIVEIDAHGFIHIQGRAKRFAKIGGEMVSLAAVEECAGALWPEHTHAAMAVHDERKGEQILLITEHADATREAFAAHAKTHGLTELAFPRRVVHAEALPRLGSGKVDYMELKQWLERESG